MRRFAWTFCARLPLGAGTAALRWRAGARVCASSVARNLRSRFVTVAPVAGLLGTAAVLIPTASASASDAATVTGAATTSTRRRERVRRGRGGGVAAIRVTRSRSSTGALGVSSHSAVARSGDKSGPHFLLELLERAGEPRRAGRCGDAEDAGGLLRVELEDDAQRDHLALGAGERSERLPEDRPELVWKLDLRPAVRLGDALFAPPPTVFGAKMVERRAAGQLAEPGLSASSFRVES